MNIGYARVSTLDQNINLQLDALSQAGADRIFQDVGVSGAKASRPGLDATWDHLRAGDTLIVWRLDRLGRSLSHLVGAMTELQERGVEFRSITEGIDTSTPTGRLTYHIFGAIAQFERELIRERTMAGLAAARARGRKGGRKPSLTKQQQRRVTTLLRSGELTYQEIADMFGVSKSTIYRAGRN